MNPKISVLILTHNRARLLERCLRALAAQRRRADEIVVVDNGSVDATPALLNRFRDGDFDAGVPPLPIRVVQGSPAEGWAAARNRAVGEAASDWVAFLDDDCEAPPDWLQHVERHAREHRDVVGGLVEAPADTRFPAWWHPDMGWAVGLSVPGHKTPLAGSVFYPQTANLAARRAVLLEEPFQEIDRAALDADGGSAHARKDLYLGGREDAELWRRLRLHARRTHFDPAMRVVHHVDPSRFAFRALCRRAFQDGVALQRRENEPRLLDFAVDTLVSLPGGLLFDVWNTQAAPHREAARRLVWAARQWGQFAGAARMHGPMRIAARGLFYAGRNVARRGLGVGKRTLRRAGLRCIALRHPTPRKLERPRSVVVAAVGFLGDMVLLHPFLSGLKNSRPGVRVTLLTNALGEALYRHDPSVDQIVLLGATPSEARGDGAAIRYALKSSRAEVVLVPYFYGVSPKTLFASPRAFVAGFSEEIGFPRRWWYDRLHKRVAKPAGRPEADNLYRLFREAGFEGPLQETPLAFLPDEVFSVSQDFRTRGLGKENLIVVAPATEKASKFWEEGRWSKVVRYLEDEYGATVALTSSPKGRALCERIAQGAGSKALLWCEDDVRLLALRLAEARLVVGVDNGVKHLAVAGETPTLTLFGPTDERQWGAVFHPHRHGVVRACAWDLTAEERVGLPDNWQMQCITTQYVLRALDEMLAEH